MCSVESQKKICAKLKSFILTALGQCLSYLYIASNLKSTTIARIAGARDYTISELFLDMNG